MKPITVDGWTARCGSSIRRLDEPVDESTWPKRTHQPFRFAERRAVSGSQVLCFAEAAITPEATSSAKNGGADPEAIARIPYQASRRP